jgi:hypothetical protein
VTETIFVRLLKSDDKETALARSVAAVVEGIAAETVHRVHQQTFRLVPATVFAYWVSDGLRAKFCELEPLETSKGSTKATKGLATTDDLRFARVWYEVSPRPEVHGRRWVNFAKGGEYSPYYFDPYLVVDWTDIGAELKAFLNEKIGGPRQWSRWINAVPYYFRPGLTWPRRTQAGLSVRVMPAGCIFADKGPALFDDDLGQLPALLALLNARATQCFVELQMAFGSYEVGVIQRVPIPDLSREARQALGDAASVIYDEKRRLYTATETSHVFILPALLQAQGESLDARHKAWNGHVSASAGRIERTQREIDERCYRLYAISDADRQVIERELGTEVRGLPEPGTAKDVAASLISWAVGVALGRFDIRLAIGDRAIPELPDPFAPLPAYLPGMLPEGPAPEPYPLRVDADGILVDDEGHEDDIVRRVEAVFDVLWREQSAAYVRQACDMLGVRTLRDWFRRLGSGGFWDDHFKRYSKSRRNAPIYWPLQSPKGFYTVWLYYHRLNADTLPKVLGPRYLGGKIQRVKHSIEALRPGGDVKPDITKQEERQLAERQDILVDLEEFQARLLEVVRLQNDRGETVGWAPDRDDGVVLNAAPLHAVIPWPRRKKQARRQVSELAIYWQQLADGRYDWAHVAIRYWPDRVTGKCRTDKSLALAHGLDAQFFPGLRDALRAEAKRARDDAEAPDDDMLDEFETAEDEENDE